MLVAKTKLSFKSVSTGQAKRNGTDDPELKTWLFLRFNLGKSKVLEKRALLGLKTLDMS
jgi:hypothetical protein